LVGLFTGGLTAFYIARAIWLTVHGQPRDPHLFEHAHESPRVMTVPLLALAVGTVLAGAIGIPPDQGFIHSFLAPSVETGAAEHVPPLGTIVFLALASVVASVIGIAISLSMYARGRPDPAAVARASGPYYRILVNKYYVDELYDHRFVDVARAVAGASGPSMSTSSTASRTGSGGPSRWAAPVCVALRPGSVVTSPSPSSPACPRV